MHDHKMSDVPLTEGELSHAGAKRVLSAVMLFSLALIRLSMSSVVTILTATRSTTASIRKKNNGLHGVDCHL